MDIDSQASRQRTVPQISLPKGGGAIQGIGEKFSSNSMTGTASLTIPFPSSPARSAFSPQLTLSYDSGEGNGVFGVGWSLFLPSITRKTDKGLPQYRDEQESDVFILSGSEDLVPSTTERIQERDGYRIQFYRPRIEGLFARIEKWTRICNGEIHWRSFTKDNTLTIYGDTSESRIYDPSHPLHIFRWLISASFDNKGNAIRYRYAAEDLAGVRLDRPSERRRGAPANRHLKSILYGNREPILRPAANHADAGWMFEVVFDFGDEEYEVRVDAHGQEYACYDSEKRRSWPVREDPFSSYRSGFEIRTYRLCRRVLMLHHFPDELSVPSYLVRTTELHYDEESSGSFLVGAVQSGYVMASDGSYLKSSLPRLNLDYTPNPLENESPGPFEVCEADSRNLPTGVGGEYRWIDLDGEGISGVLYAEGPGWYFKSNLGRGRFGPTKLVSPKPSSGDLQLATCQLLDVAGQGQLDLVDLTPGSAGFYERTQDGADGLDRAWGSFRTFGKAPVIDWSDANLRFVDLTGDGIADVLITEDVAFHWHPSLKNEGFGPSVRIPAPLDENQGPRVVFSDSEQAIFLADMSGDGLNDIVRIRNGEVCYWPNLGYGRFGAKVLIEGSPWFEDSGVFDERRIRLADTDGSGTTDILYLAENEIQIYLNCSGNSLSACRTIAGLPTPGVNSISVVDFLGRGTACLVWSSELPSFAGQPLRYVDLMRGQKPHLLTRITNNLGAETLIEYGSSSEFYLADKAAGQPWVTSLPFPVHVVSRVETRDYVSRNRFVSRFSYHHGYFDPIEREFRGFGRVDRIDSEEFDATLSSGADSNFANEDIAWRIPPSLIKTWYHTGVFLNADRISRHLGHEYYREPGEDGSLTLEDTVLPPGLSPEDAREACRALKRSVLRQEVYALDGSVAAGRPYTVTESNYTIRTIQPRGENRHGVFFVHGRQSLAMNYERKLYETEGALRADPRITHTITLEVDEYGNPLKSASFAYGRRIAGKSTLLTSVDHDKQAKSLATLAIKRYTNLVSGPDAYRIPSVARTSAYEIVQDASVGGPLRFDDVRELLARASDGQHDLPPEDVAAKVIRGTGPHRRLLQESATLYRSDDLERLLPPGVLESLALPGESYTLALTTALISEVYADKVTHPERLLREDGGYVDLDGDGRWWIPSGRTFFSPNSDDSAARELEIARRHFFLPRRFRDAFGNVSFVSYDRHDLAPAENRDPLDNTIRARLDYRVLLPGSVTDANGNLSAVAFDALGLVVGTAIMGKEGENLGDSLEGFVADLPESVVKYHMLDPFADPWAILANATSRLVYDFFAFYRSRHQSQPEPAATYTLARETHSGELPEGQRTKVQHSFSYSDGLGREVQRKVQGGASPSELNSRWIGTGWTIFNNKGKPVRQYEPFFSPTHRFEFASVVGVTATLIYDPMGRVVASLNPDHTFQKTIFDPWQQETWDANDTVLLEPQSDLDIGSYLRSIPPDQYLPTWFQQRQADRLGAAEQDAARKASAHANTPSISFTDSMGRPFLAIQHNRVPGEYAPVDEFYATRTELDIQGNALWVTDPLGRIILSTDYDLIQRNLHHNSCDSGERWSLTDVGGNAIVAVDSLGQRARFTYDKLRRPLAMFIRVGGGEEKLAESAEYGESQPNPERRNLRGRQYLQFDQAGILGTLEFDFKGNLLLSTRQMLAEYCHQVNWASSPKLESEVYSSESVYDALNRLVLVTEPDRSLIRPGYNSANLLERLDVNLKGTGIFTPYVMHIEYNAKGQRVWIGYGNGVRTSNTYNPLTFRLTRIETTRVKDTAHLQDLSYVYDPCGNVSFVVDRAQQSIYFKNQVVTANSEYTYDATYRLIKADGREQAGAPDRPATSYNDVPRIHLPLPGDGNAMRRYRERYQYDAAGNIVEIVHSAGPTGTWRRRYEYATIGSNNRLTKTRVGDDEDHYTYDANGNMLRMQHLPSITWDFKNQMASSRSQVVLDKGSATTYYAYDAGGQRVRKGTVDAAGNRRRDRIYAGGFEMYREYAPAGNIKLERTTLHIMDGSRRFAIVETRGEETTVRYQFDNRLGSACLELDEDASVLTYEEYFPYGSTSYRADRSVAETGLKRYRFLGKERDEETGFNYHGARYYALWLGRWTSADPSGISGGLNLYAYSNCCPTCLVDPDGRQPVLGGNWEYGQQVLNRHLLGVNVQRDHPIWVSLRRAQRTSPLGTAYYNRNISAAEGELTVLRETGRGYLHTELGRLQRQIAIDSMAGDIDGEVALMRRTREAVAEAAGRTGAAVDWLAEDTALLSNQAVLHGPMDATRAELGFLNGPNTMTDESVEQGLNETHPPDGDPWDDSDGIPDDDGGSTSEEGDWEGGGEDIGDDFPTEEMSRGGEEASGVSKVLSVGGDVLKVGLEVLGVVGDVFAISDAIDQVSKGNYVDALLDIGMVLDFEVAGPIKLAEYGVEQYSMAGGAILNAQVQSAGMLARFLDNRATLDDIVQSGVDISSYPKDLQQAINACAYMAQCDQ